MSWAYKASIEITLSNHYHISKLIVYIAGSRVRFPQTQSHTYTQNRYCCGVRATQLCLSFSSNETSEPIEFRIIIAIFKLILNILKLMVMMLLQIWASLDVKLIISNCLLCKSVWLIGDFSIRNITSTETLSTQSILNDLLRSFVRSFTRRYYGSVYGPSVYMCRTYSFVNSFV